MRFKVPQDVQREDTIIGPITLKQLGILGAGGGFAYAIYVSLAKTYFIEVWLPPVAIVVCVTLAFAFLKVHALKFHIFLMSFIQYHLLPKQRTWIQETGNPFISSFDHLKDKKKETKVAEQKQTKSIEELSEVVDSYGKNITKKQELNKIINQNYK